MRVWKEGEQLTAGEAESCGSEVFKTETAAIVAIRG